MEQSALQGELLELSGRDRRAVRSRAARTITRSRAGAMRRRVVGTCHAAAAGHGSGVRRARRPRMCCITVAKDDPAVAAKYPCAGLPHLADRPVLRRGDGIHQRAHDGGRTSGPAAAGASRGARRRGLAPTPARTRGMRRRPRRRQRPVRHRADARRFLRRRVSVSGVGRRPRAPTSHGCRSCQTRSRKTVWQTRHRDSPADRAAARRDGR